MQEQDPGPKLISGDGNASVYRLPVIQDMITSGKIIDIGSIASMYGGIDNDTTCKVNANCKATRKDYVFANPEAHSLIDKFEVDHCSLIPVHNVIRVIFKGEAPVHTYDAVQLPKSINDVFKDRCIDVYGEDNIASAKIAREKKKPKIKSTAKSLCAK